MDQGRTGNFRVSLTEMDKHVGYTDHYRSEFLLAEKNHPRGMAPELKRLKNTAIEYFLTSGFPSVKDEEWRFTNLQPLIKTNFSLQADTGTLINYENALAKYAIPIQNARVVLFVNGKYIPHRSDGLSRNEDVTIRSINQAIEENNPLIQQYLTEGNSGPQSAIRALNTGMFNDGIILNIPDDTVVSEPFYFIFLTHTDAKNQATYPRNLVITGKNSKITLVEQYQSDAQSLHFTNAVTELFIGPNSTVDHIKLQLESAGAYHMSTLIAPQQTGSRLNQHSVMIGGSIARNEIVSVLQGEEIECTLNGLSLAAGNQLIDNHTSIDHAKPNCASHEIYKAILDGSSKGVFNGKILVRKDAQKTDAKQTNKTLLLSDNATMNTKPQLEIFADDVKCTHGATIGYLDADAIFYLRSRGISEEIARDLLTYAFANDVISRIPIDSIREFLSHLVYSRLKQGRKLETIERTG